MKNSEKFTLKEDTSIFEVSSCPHCQSTSIVRNGHKNNKQQYRCNQCKKSFQATTGTPTHGLHLTDRIPLYIKALQQGLTIIKAAQFAKISKDTSFSWRHKFISSIKNTPLIYETHKTNTIALFLTPYSEKGRRKAPEKNRKTSKTLLIIQNNRINLKKLDIKNTSQQIKQIIANGNIISTLKNREITNTIKKLHTNQVLKQKKLKRQLQNNINFQIFQLTQWMTKFRGVATKYLQQYWNWYSGLYNINQITSKEKFFERLCVENQTLSTYQTLRKL